MNLIDAVQALLFASNSPAQAEQMADALNRPLFEIEEALERLGQRMDQSGGLMLIRIAGGYQLCTKPEFASYVAKFTQPQEAKISRSLMEVLAIVAYQQPVTAAEIEAVRGVQSDYSIRQLAEKRLIVEVGRKHAPGRPVLYGTTQQFLHLFNLDDLSQLPNLAVTNGEVLSIEGRDNKNQPALEFNPAEEPEAAEAEAEAT